MNIDLMNLNRLDDDTSINTKYEEYLTSHISNVQKGYEWLKTNLPELVSVDNYFEETAYYGELDDIIAQHDRSKYTKLPDAEYYYDLKCEYDAYANYFYEHRTPEVEKAFNYAWLAHIHANPHHWQHWLLQNDDPDIGLKPLDMPYVFIVEMICDHWSFSWKENRLTEIFEWYDKNKAGIIFSPKTRATYESILEKIKEKLKES